MNALLEEIEEHLTYQRYTVSRVSGLAPDAPPILNATCPNKPWFWIFSVENGAFFRALFNISPAAVADTAGFQSFLNEINAGCILARYYQAQNFLLVAAWYFGKYEKQRFNIFFEQLLADIYKPAMIWREQIQKYLSPQ